MKHWIAAVVAVSLFAGTARADDGDPAYACHVPTGKLVATFKPETDLKDLVTWVVGFTCKNVVFSEEVARHAPRVTVVSPNKMSAKQALELFVDTVEATGLVVVQKPDTIIIKLGPGMAHECPGTDLSAMPDPRDSLLAPQAMHSRDDVIDPAALTDQDVETGIKVVDDTHRQVTRAVADKILANPMDAAKGARIVPNVKDGAPHGLRLYGVRPSSIYARLGLLNGDTVLSVNGTEVTSPDKALEVYSKLRDLAVVDVTIERRGQQLTLHIQIK